MRALSLREVHVWLGASSLFDAEGKVKPGNVLGPLTVQVPTDTGRKTNLARVLAGEFQCQTDGLLWINEYGIWPSSENRLLFDALRCFVGEERSLEELPAHLLQEDDGDVLSAMLALIFYFCWGALVVRGDMGVIARISHDECVDFYGSGEALRRIEGTLVAQKYVGPSGWQEHL